MRIRRKPWIDEELKNNTRYIREAKEKKGKWDEYFGNENEIHIEIGCGKGQFIIENAKRNKNINYIGIEKDEQIVAYASRKLRQSEEEAEEIKNLTFFTGDAKELLEYFTVGEISRVYLNFSDPWRERKKWEKRRLTHRGFIELYKKLLDGKGEIYFKTDNKPLFEFTVDEFVHCNLEIKNKTYDLHSSDYKENIMTEYEERFSERGMNIHRIEGHIKKQP